MSKQRAVMPWTGMGTYHGAYLIGSAASPAAPADTPAMHSNKATCAESIEMALHEKVTRGDLPQRTETAT